eukprot:1161990-Pelagomonas_calceolata.AAC.5
MKSLCIMGSGTLPTSQPSKSGWHLVHAQLAAARTAARPSQARLSKRSVLETPTIETCHTPTRHVSGRLELQLTSC